MKGDDKEDFNDLMGKIDGKITQGSFNDSSDAKSGKGASVDKSIVGPYKAVDVSPSQDFAKKGTGGTNDFAKISKLADDMRLNVSFKG